jgi:hypothetical protein
MAVAEINLAAMQRISFSIGFDAQSTGRAQVAGVPPLRYKGRANWLGAGSHGVAGGISAQLVIRGFGPTPRTA